LPGLAPVPFSLAEDRRAPLLAKEDQLTMVRRGDAKILAFEMRDADTCPWARL
jgi:hypothetical protein